MAYFSGGSDFAGRSCHDTGRANRNLCRVIVWAGVGNAQLYAGYFDRIFDRLCSGKKTGYADCIYFY
mgnify:CR=1 FL=1